MYEYRALGMKMKDHVHGHETIVDSFQARMQDFKRWVLLKLNLKWGWTSFKYYWLAQLNQGTQE